jgi:hypothetical protein
MSDLVASVVLAHEMDHVTPATSIPKSQTDRSCSGAETIGALDHMEAQETTNPSRAKATTGGIRRGEEYQEAERRA